ncbi:restriction endonuclease subunit S [Bacteroides fragilis]|uniref:restriction endonuclease subunit S n=1 Tax=Bacteroidaceae TaxID=815 RepID=UPI000A07C2A4|nr:restriction endonuclease subunit S [Bacteroides fragilis]
MVCDVPALRFPEFTDEWHKQSLGEIGETIIGLTYKPSDVVESNGTIVLRSSNIKNGVIDYSDLVRVNKPIKERIITKENDILICARNGSQRLIGKNAIIKKEDANNTFGAFMMVYRSKDNPFILPLLSTKRYFSQVGENLGARINQITTSDFNGFDFYFPNSHAERAKIAELFRLIDERIATQNKIIEDLKKLKSAIYQEMFGSLVAQTLKLGQVAEVVKGKQVNGTELLEQGDYYVMNGGTLPSGWLYKYNTEANTISISEGGNSCGYVQYNTSPYWSGGHCYSLKILHPQETSDLYLYHFLKWQEENIMALRIGSGLPNIQKKDLLHFPVILPTITQQNKIVLILSAIEEKVSCEISITQYFVKQKEYLLSQLFI